MIVCLDLHDFSATNNRLDLLLRLKREYPNFKVSLFTVPEEKGDWGATLIRSESLEKIKENLDWIQIIPHGIRHDGSEVKVWDYHFTKEIAIPYIEKVFAKDDLPFEKGFCAPHWRWNNEVVKALNDLDWWGAVDPRQPLMPCPNKFYKYSHVIDAPFPTEGEVKLHGHIYGTKNDLGLCFKNLLTIPLSAEWHFVTDFLEDKV